MPDGQLSGTVANNRRCGVIVVADGQFTGWWQILGTKCDDEPKMQQRTWLRAAGVAPRCRVTLRGPLRVYHAGGNPELITLECFLWNGETYVVMFDSGRDGDTRRNGDCGRDVA